MAHDERNGDARDENNNNKNNYFVDSTVVASVEPVINATSRKMGRA